MIGNEDRKVLMKKIIDGYVQTNLVIRILIALVIGGTLGIVAPDIEFIGVIGSLFVGALKALAPMLVFLLVMSSLMNSKGEIGKRMTTVVVLYMISTLVAAILAVIVSFLFPLTLILSGQGVSAEAPGSVGEVFNGLLTGIVSNPIQAIATGNYISILFWAVLMGIAFKTIADNTSKRLIQNLSDTFSKLITWVIQFAPFGIFGLVYSTVSEFGVEVFENYANLILLLCGTMLFQMFVINAIIVAITIKANPYPLLFTCIRHSAITAFFTRSSAANIPVNMHLSKELNLDEELYSVSIPLGSTINMDGAAITITIMSIAAAHTLGIPITLSMAIGCSIIATLCACGTSGVTGGSLLLVPMGCALFGISGDIAMQVVAVGFIISFIQDSIETALNSSSDVLFTAAADFRAHNRKKI